MSRDQRPRRAVIVDSAPDAPDTDSAGSAAVGDTPLAPSSGAGPAVLPALLFLLACAGGAVAVALSLPGGAW